MNPASPSTRLFCVCDHHHKCGGIGDLCELEAEWRWKKDEPRAGNKAQYELVLAHRSQLQAFLEGIKQ